MLGKHKLYLDIFCEVYELIEHWADGSFTDFADQHIEPNAIYLVSRKEFYKNVDKIKQYANSAYIILSNPHEGSDTMVSQLSRLGLEELAKAKKVFLIGGGDMDESWPCLTYESFLPKIFDYAENISATAKTSNIFKQLDKPYKFLFLNGRGRPHRKYLIEKLNSLGLLTDAIWSNLDVNFGNVTNLNLIINGEDFMSRPRPIKLLDKKYEFESYRSNLSNTFTEGFIKHELFDNKWGDVYINPLPYVDTYFSMVTETVFHYPYSFRTEKIWKPIAIGHPWVCAANAHYYRDIRNLGFKTFGHLIDESFDSIDNNQQRIERITTVVQDLCRQNLNDFISAAEETCKYNQQLYIELRPKIRAEFPQQFASFIHNHIT